MAGILKFDSSLKPEDPTIILMKKNGDRLGLLENTSSFRFSDNMNSADEFSFVIHKEFNGHICSLWDEILDFRVIYIGEYEKYFEIYVSKDEENSITKTVTCIAMQEAELSQLNCDGIEINTEADIAREDYSPTVLYNPNNPKSSMLNRIISGKAENYVIHHVDSTIAEIQRTFTFDGVSIYDAFQEIAEEIGCLFVFGEEDATSPMNRTISVYDLQSNCRKCGYRGEFTERCPECGNTDILEGYGEDTTIFINADNLAEEINFTSDTDSVKNCFKLVAGDDLMTATIINANPAGSAYLWYFSDDMKKDMSSGLVSKIDSYDKDYKYYQTEYSPSISSTIINKYNTLIKKYQDYDEDLKTVITPIKGYQALMQIYYDTIDFYGYLQNSLMPTPEIDQTNASKQAALLTAANLSPVSVQDDSYISLATANSALLAYTKVYIDTSRYKIEVKNSSLSNKVWTGNFTVTSYTDEEDTADSATITVTFNDDYENFLKQQIDKTLSRDKEDAYGIVDLFHLSLSSFKAELKKYCLSYLQIFNDACQSCLDILIEQGVSDNKSNKDLYTKLYQPYLDKKKAIAAEASLRETELDTIGGTLDEKGNLKSKGLKNYVESEKSTISKELDFQTYIGSYWNELCLFRRDDIWKNDNYSSEGLTNEELFKKAKEFIEAAQKDIIKSATLQHSIETTLKNLLIIKEFSPIVNYFKVGNWIRIETDGDIYKLRLIGYEIDYDDLNNISVTFSDVIKLANGISDIQSILKQSQSMSTSYASTKHQAEQGSESKEWIAGWVQKGLDATVTKIVNNASDQSVTYDQHGLLFRKKNPLTEEYDDVQLKIINSTLAVTTDNWETTKTALGKFIFYNPKTGKEEEGYGLIADKVVGNIILSEELGIYNKSGSMTFTDEDGLTIKNNKNTVAINPNNDKLFRIANTDNDLLYVDNSGNLNVFGKITASSGSTIGYWTISDNAIYHTSSSFGNASGKYFGTNGLSITDKFKVDSSGNITASGTLSLAGGKLTYSNNVLSVSGKIIASSGSSFGHWTISDVAIYNGSSSFGSSSGKYFGSSGLSITNKFKVSSSGNLTCAGSITASGTLNLAGGKISYSDNTLTVSGKITASSGSSFGHWTISDSAIYNGSSSFGASSGKYFGSSGLSITDKFKVSSTGNLTCAGNITSSGNITATGTLSLAGGKLTYSNNTLSVSGSITATAGKIANFTISKGYLYNGISIGNSGSCGISAGSELDGSDSRIFWAGNNNFRVTKDGVVYCSNIEISGGAIGGWKITSTDIYNDNGNTSAGIGKYATSMAFWAGSSYANRNSAPFRVGHDGSIVARNAVIAGSVDGISGTFSSLSAGSSEFHPTWILIDADGRGKVRIGTPDYSDWVDLTLRPDSDNIGNIGTPDLRWSTCYSVVFGQSSVRNKKEEIQAYDTEIAYEELKDMPLYTYFYKGFSPENKNMSLGTMIDYIPAEVMMTTPNGNDSYNLSNLIFWHIAATQVMQKKIEDLENRISELEGN